MRPSYILTLVASTALALWLGPVMLVVNPLLFGVPHLLASYRYAPKLSSSRRGTRVAFALGLAAACGVAASRVDLPRGALEAAALAGTAFVSPVGLALSGLLLAFPAAILGALVLAHNGIAYLFWHRLAPSRSVLASFAALAALSVAIACGALDGFLFATPVSTTSWLTASGLDLDATAAAIAGRDAHPWTLERLTAIAALGQAMHYYVWLVAIPRARQEPLALRADVGLAPILLTLGAALALLALAVVDLRTARTLFLVLASTHAFFEIGVLAAGSRTEVARGA